MRENWRDQHCEMVERKVGCAEKEADCKAFLRYADLGARSWATIRTYQLRSQSVSSGEAMLSSRGNPGRELRAEEPLFPQQCL